MRSEKGRTFDPVVLEVFFDMIDSLEAQLPELRTQPVSLLGVEPITTDRLFEPSFGPVPRTPTEKALRDIASAQREVLSLYEISQTLGSTLKLSEVLPIVIQNSKTSPILLLWSYIWQRVASFEQRM